MGSEARVEIRHESDILAARKVARTIATRLNFSEIDLILIATAISEIARNILTYATQGDMSFEEVHEPSRRGLIVTARDQGPGIPDIERAMEDGFSSGKGLGLGLPGARRLMDEFIITSTVGTGTTIVMKKWAK
jgi:serine/threonine-protein kinase RsbT